MILVLVAIVGLWLTKTGKIEGFVSILAQNGPASTSTAITLGEYTAALLVYLFVLTLLTPGEGLGLTAVLVLGALIYNEESTGGNGVLTTLSQPITGPTAGQLFEGIMNSPNPVAYILATGNQ